jgi:hypothetical protein
MTDTSITINDCSICMEDMGVYLSVLKCGHKFHSRCIIEYSVKNNNKKLTCPLCRDKILGDTVLEEPIATLQINNDPSIIGDHTNNIHTIGDHSNVIVSKVGVSLFVGVCLFVVIVFISPSSN